MFRLDESRLHCGFRETAKAVLSAARVFRLDESRLHCGRFRKLDLYIDSRVFRLDESRLHCGGLPSSSAGASSTCVPARREPAPLRRGLPRPQGVGQVGVPARREPAPLRLDVGAGGVGDGGCSGSTRAGSIAAADLFGWPAPASAGVPARREPAPLRSYDCRLTAFDIAADGSLSNRRVWADLGDGAPDGVCLDAENAIWYGDVPHERCVCVREGGKCCRRSTLTAAASPACSGVWTGGRCS